MSRIALPVPVLVLSLTLASGCGAVVGHRVQKGMTFYHAGNLPCAMVVWNDLEPEELRMNPKGHLRYLAYRALTHYRLGQLPAAHHFLARALQAAQYARPGWLSSQIEGELHTLARTGGRAVGAIAGPPAPAPAPDVVTIQ